MWMRASKTVISSLHSLREVVEDGIAEDATWTSLRSQSLLAPEPVKTELENRIRLIMK